MKKTTGHPVPSCLERVPEGVPLDRAACGKALEAALAAPSLDERTACTRLLWLLDPRPEGLRLAGELPGLTPETLARHIVHPREAVLGIIQRRTGLDAGFLDQVYESLRSPGGPGNPDRLADMPEERILQEMKWWLLDLRFPEYYLRNTPADVIAAQILANRSWELLGGKSEKNERMKVSMVSREGTRMHWVHRKRCLEVEEEIERAFAADGRLRDVSVYSPFKDLLLYIVEQTPPGEGDEFSSAAPQGVLAATEPQARRRSEEVRAEVLAKGGIVVSRSFKKETGEHRVMVRFTARMEDGHASADVRPRDEGGITDFHTVYIGDGVVQAGLAVEGDAQLAGAGLGHKLLLEERLLQMTLLYHTRSG